MLNRTILTQAGIVRRRGIVLVVRPSRWALHCMVAARNALIAAAAGHGAVVLLSQHSGVACAARCCHRLTTAAVMQQCHHGQVRIAA